jgi:hypothetical protein
MKSTTRNVIAGAAVAGLITGASATFARASAVTTAGVQATRTMDAGTHSCKGQNACKGQGGCKTGDNGCKGKNSCKGKGGCSSSS